jgi:RND family efflux transporter MFP subunit
MRRLLAILLIVSMIFPLSACTKAEETAVKERARAVKVIEIQESENKETLNYIGTVDSKEIVKYSFKTTGKLGKVFVEKGDKVKKGDKLVQLDMQDLNFQISAAKSNLDTAKLNIKKAEDSLNYYKDLFNKMENLYKEGTISKDQYDQIKLQKDTAETTYNQAKSQFEAAKADYEYKLSLLEDATIYANQDGSVIDTYYEEGELVPQGYPVVSVRSSIQIINVGIAQRDLKKIKIGTEAVIDVEGEKANGVVTNIAEAPDETTRTYNAEVTIKDKNFRLGSIAKVVFDIGKERGIWIPISAIMSDEEDYVYIVQGDRAFKRIVELGEIYEDKIMVKGVKSGELLVVSGMKNLIDGSKVNIQE